MEMEMEMRAGEDIEIGEDITAPIDPLSFSLHDSLLHSHCSACFSPLPFPSPSPSPFPNNNTLLYCSPQCSSTDSPLHFSSAEHHLLQSPPFPDTSDLRAALRLLHSHRHAFLSSHTHRVAGLLTNRNKFMTHHQEDSIVHDEMVHRIRVGAKAMAAARAMTHRLLDNREKLTSEDEIFEKISVGAMTDNDGISEKNAVVMAEEVALCLVITNAVDVQDSEGRTLGIAIYGPTFSWINHSCSPNSCYRFSLSSPLSPPSSSSQMNLRIVPSSCNTPETQVRNLIPLPIS